MPLWLRGFAFAGADELEGPQMSTEAAPQATPAQRADAVPAFRYSATLAGEIERRWQQHWSEHGTFHAPNPAGPWGQDVVPPDKLFVMDMFPYPSGEGL